jgi:hypothetical protein
VPSVLRETGRLLLAHLDLFTRITLTVWLPATVLANYLDFFTAGRGAAARGIGVILVVEIVCGPLVAAATISALADITRGLRVGYWDAMRKGLSAWPRLFVVRLVTGLMVAGGFLLLVLPGLILLLRYAVVDSVAVLEDAGPGQARRRSAELTATQRREIFLTGATLVVVVWTSSLAASAVLQVVPPLNHFVVRVLLDCVFAVVQSVFTIALFLFYRHGVAAPASPPAPAVMAA